MSPVIQEHMMKFLKSLFQPVGASKVLQNQLFDARRLQLEHEAAAEHHQALAAMYRSRVERLEVEKAKVGTEE